MGEIAYFSLTCAIVGFSWINFFVEPNGAFGWMPIIYEDICASMKVRDESVVKNAIHKLLFECEKCLSGQLGFWGYLVFSGGIFQSLLSAFLAVFFAALINKLWEKYLL